MTTAINVWKPTSTPAALDGDALVAAIARFREPTHVIREVRSGRVGIGQAGEVAAELSGDYVLLATLPALYPEWLGNRSFGEVHGVRFPYVAGAMANGIATAEMVIAMARAGMLGFFGAAGLAPEQVEKAIDEIQRAVTEGQGSWGCNLIHSPNEPEIETAVADLYLRRGVGRVSASAYMALTPAIVRYAASGLTRDASGRVIRANRVVAKISRPEVARRFISPAPANILDGLVSSGLLSREEADLAALVPLAEDLTVESDSGGHTDNRPLAALFPTICTLRDQIAREKGYTDPIRVGAAGGIGTPSAVASAFALGADYVLTGSINQATLESGMSGDGKRLLAEAGIADVRMAPAADMFEMGVKVQVLHRGTVFAARGARLYDAYVNYGAIEAIPPELRAKLEKELLRASFEEIWEETRSFFETRDPRENEKAERDPKHKLALVCRWYLGKSSRWAISGDESRRVDYQIWCGPAMGAFNAWSAGTFLADPAQRGVVQVALNLLEGAAVVTRAQQLRSYGVPVPAAGFDYRPQPLA